MKFVVSTFGFMSGMGTSLGLLPNILILCFLMLTGNQDHSVSSFVLFTILAKITGDWIFWKLCFDRIKKEEEFLNWKTVVNTPLLFQSNVIVSVFILLGDGLLDAVLVYKALNMLSSPVWVFVALFGCQLLSSPIQGFLSDYFSRKNSILFANLIGLFVFLAVIYLENNKSQVEFFSILFAPTMQMICLLCVKGLFANTSVVAKAAIADVLKIEIVKKFEKA